MPVPLADRDVNPAPADTLEVHRRINRIRELVSKWRNQSYPGAHRLSRELLEFWSSADPEPRPFFAQVESLETLIWLTEVAPHDPAGNPVRLELENISRAWNHGICRFATKMATGTGKTRVMAMIILWKALVSQDLLHVLIITPNLTVRDRLVELNPAEGTALYDSLLPPHLRLPFGRMHVSIFNFHVFQRKNTLAIDGPGDIATSAARKLLAPDGQDPRWLETHDQMIHRVLKRHKNASTILVLNDEAHHCYPSSVRPKKSNAESREYEQHAALWFSAIQTLHKQGRLESVYDLSATPMYLRVPPNLDYPLFPWVISDYPLIEAVEAGLTKVPRVPVSDDTRANEPAYRNIFRHLDQNQRKLDPQRIPSEVKNLLNILHEKYLVTDKIYASATKPVKPVFIVVANTTQNADAFYRYLAGIHDETNGIWKPGPYEIFSNVTKDGPVDNPPTLLVHSGIEDATTQDKKAEKLANFQKLFFSAGKDANVGEQAAHIRRVFNTVGQSGELGEHIRCLISVSMLTEGWDVRTVTHILGFRAFDSQLLCEQVAGRALRRTSVPVIGEGQTLELEYADIFGVPFTFMRGGEIFPPPIPRDTWLVRSLPEQSAFRLFWPNVDGYRMAPPGRSLKFQRDMVQPFRTETPHHPTVTTVSGTHGEQTDSRRPEERRNRIRYSLAKEALHVFEPHDPGPIDSRFSLFTAMICATDAWLNHPDVNIPNIQLLASDPNRANAAIGIAESCIEDTSSQAIQPIFADELDSARSRVLSTSGVNFLTSLKHRYPVNQNLNCLHSELNSAACHSQAELIIARHLDNNRHVLAWVRNFRLGWAIPWYDQRSGSWRRYEPDFVVRIKHPDIHHLIIEFKGPVHSDDVAKQNSVEKFWLPAVNNSTDLACRGRWHYCIVKDTSEIEPAIQAEIQRIRN